MDYPSSGSDAFEDFRNFLAYHRLLTSTLLVILDGWGHGDASDHNAIHVANTPNWDSVWTRCPHGLLECSGELVGLPHGQMGNSEVGHMTIGSGRIVPQDLTRIDKALADGSFARRSAVQDLANLASSRRVHVAGLLSPGGVHSHERQIWTLVEYLTQCSAKVSVHAFLDGRDTPPKSAEQSLSSFEEKLAKQPLASIASICGRYYAMDRDERWSRTKSTYEMLVGHGATHIYTDSIEALHAAYNRDETDEFVEPTRTHAFHPVQDGDVFLFMNFRADRARQLAQSFVSRDFVGFERTGRPALTGFFTLTPYGGFSSSDDSASTVQVLFEHEHVRNSLGECISNNGLSQLRIAESEKSAHVTYFFSGGSEELFNKETRKIVDSQPVSTYDLCPRMSADAVAAEVSQSVHSKNYDLIVCNLANADMVGHTGNFGAALQAVECVDECLGVILQACAETKSHCFVTADHGNVECMYNTDSGQSHTAHTRNHVPFVYDGPADLTLDSKGTLADIAPTILDVMGLPIAPEMTGRSLATKAKNVPSV